MNIEPHIQRALTAYLAIPGIESMPEEKRHRIRAALLALSQVAGVDLNPYAIAITRFRLTLEFCALTGLKLEELPPLPFNLAVGDSLLTGRVKPGQKGGQEP